MAGRLQEGIFWDSGQTPGAHFKILFLRVTHGQTAADVHRHLSALWEIWSDLKQGRVRELGAVTVPPKGLTVLLAFGSNLFDLDGVQREAPEALGPKNRFLSPRRDSGGGKLLPGGGLHYAADVTHNPATEELAVQFIADSPLAVHRAQVETWRYLESQADPQTQLPPMQIASFFDGFHREDRRSWIGFHDGISNLRKGEERRSVIEIRPADAGFDDWTVGGTTMVFLHLPVDLRAWDAIPTAQQELLVGRAKGSGCPLKAAAGGVGVPVDGCPVGATIVREDGSIDPAFREIPSGVDETIRVSHVQRANHNQNTPDKIDSRRIYRQGYEFLSPTRDNSGLRVGLNFVSFQDDPARCIFMLSNFGWLGSVSFGGADDAQTAEMQGLIQVRAAAVFLVPPAVDGEAFPGASLLLPLPVA